MQITLKTERREESVIVDKKCFSPEDSTQDYHLKFSITEHVDSDPTAPGEGLHQFRMKEGYEN